MGSVVISSIFFSKQKTAYEMRISDWSSDVCSSDLQVEQAVAGAPERGDPLHRADRRGHGIDLRRHCLGHRGRRGRLHRRHGGGGGAPSSEERRVGKEWVRPCRSRWSPSLSNTKAIRERYVSHALYESIGKL